MNTQGELEFGPSNGSAGYDAWLAQRKRAALELGRKLNLPIGHPVEIWLAGGVRLRGILQLTDDIAFADETRLQDIRFRVDGVKFELRDIDSFVRQD